MTMGVILAAWSIFGSGRHAEQHYTFAVSAGARLRAETSNGKIEVTTGRPGSAVTVTVVKRADTPAELNALGADASVRNNVVTLRAVYPSRCESGSCGGEISFFVVVPPRTALDLNSSNGSVTAGGIGADARLTTSNGSVAASYATFGGVARVWLSTSNGSVTLALPSSAKIGRLQMDTSVGRIVSAWPVRVDRSSFVGGSVDQTLSSDGAAVTLSTTNGSIVLKKT